MRLPGRKGNSQTAIQKTSTQGTGQLFSLSALEYLYCLRFVRFAHIVSVYAVNIKKQAGYDSVVVTG